MSNLMLAISLLISLSISVSLYLYSYSDTKSLESATELDSIEYEKYLKSKEEEDRDFIKKFEKKVSIKPTFTGVYCADIPYKMIMKARNNIFNIWALNQKEVDESKDISAFSGVYNVRSPKSVEITNFRSTYKDYVKKSTLSITKVRNGFVERFSVIDEGRSESIKFSSENCVGLKTINKNEMKFKFMPSYCSNGENRIKINFKGQDYIAKKTSNEMTPSSESLQAGTVIKSVGNMVFVKSFFGFDESSGPFSKLIVTTNNNENIIESFYNVLNPDEVFKAESCK